MVTVHPIPEGEWRCTAARLEDCAEIARQIDAARPGLAINVQYDPRDDFVKILFVCEWRGYELRAYKVYAATRDRDAHTRRLFRHRHDAIDFFVKGHFLKDWR